MHIAWVHSSVVRAADCRSAGPWFESGRTLTSAPAQRVVRTPHRHTPITARCPSARTPPLHLWYNHMRARPATGSAMRASLHMGAPPPDGRPAVGQALASGGRIRSRPLRRTARTYAGSHHRAACACTLPGACATAVQPPVHAVGGRRHTTHLFHTLWLRHDIACRPPTHNRVHSSVVRAADCRSAGP